MSSLSILKISVIIFLIGIVFQFLLHTFITFELQITGGIWDIVRLWKELFVIAWYIFAFIFFVWGPRIYRKKMIIILSTLKGRYFLFLITIGLFIFFTLFIHEQSFTELIVAFKYDIILWGIFAIATVMPALLTSKEINQILKVFIKFIKILLITAIFRWLIIVIEPNALNYIGYDSSIYEGTVGFAPPATYYTREQTGLARLQFLFERPIMRGFFLIAFWPIFFITVLRKRNIQQSWYRRVLYIANVILTFSRAAWGARLIQTIVLASITHTKKKKIYRYIGIIPFLIIVGWLISRYSQDILTRSFSNTGHIEMLERGRSMFIDSRIFGQGAATAGPASHQIITIPNFNPENQFLQIFIEFGIIGGIAWLGLLSILILYGFFCRKDIYGGKVSGSKKRQLRIKHWESIGVAVGLIGLSIEGMVLHSFSDRMSIYPFMLVAGLIIGQSILLKKRHNNKGQY